MSNNGDSVKVTLLGNSGVGKTCIIYRFTNNDYKEGTMTTRGADYSQKSITIKNQTINLDLWDTAGQENYRSLGRHFYKDSLIVILVYDITNRESFEDLKTIWYNDLKRYGEKYSVLAVVGNKSDLFENEVVSEDEGRKFAEEKNAEFMLVSAKTGDNITILFNVLVNKYLDPSFQEQIEPIIQKNEDNIKIKKQPEKGKKKGGCC
jgi:small GTP-binding protein